MEPHEEIKPTYEIKEPRGVIPTYRKNVRKEAIQCRRPLFLIAILIINQSRLRQ